MAGAGIYWRYLEGFDLGDVSLLPLRSALRAPLTKPFDGPTWNRLGVLGLIALKEQEDADLRAKALKESAQAFRLSSAQGYAPALPHLALCQGFMGETSAAIHTLLGAIPLMERALDGPIGPVYLPVASAESKEPALWEALLKAKGSRAQGYALLGAISSLIMPFFLGDVPHRLLLLATRCLGDVVATPWLKLGLSELNRGRLEGLGALQKAITIRPKHDTTLKALYCAYLDLCYPDLAAALASANPRLSLPTPSKNNPSISFDLPRGHLRAPPTLRAITQPLLLGLGTYFEGELPLLQALLRPGMTFIDVGANLGTYALPGALAVGLSGCVLALEPWPLGAHCIAESAEEQGLSQLKVLQIGASQVNRLATLSRGGAPELGRLLPPGSPEEGGIPIRCQTLDSVAEEQGLKVVHLIKIDVEGHELAVLRGARGIINTHRPIILYENRAGADGWNKAAALYLQGLGYTLHRYDGFTSRLIPCENDAALATPLNLVALPRQEAP